MSVSQATSQDGSPADLILHIQDLRERRRAERDREQLIRAQSARAQAEASAERLRLMQSIAVAALGAEDLDGLLRELLDRVLEALDADRAAVVLIDGRGAGRRPRGLRRGDDRGAHGDVEGQDDVVARVAAERGPVAILDVADAGIDASSLGPAISSLLAVPLVAGAQVIGSLHVGTLTRREFDAETVDLLGLAAGRVSLAIARTRLYERERYIARQLQRSLLPNRLPEVPGVDARRALRARRRRVGGRRRLVRRDRAARRAGRRSRSATSSAAASRRRRRWARCAARCARSSCRPTTRGAMAERLNRFALGLGECVLTTVVLAIFEPAKGRLRYTNAGHPPPLIVGAAGGDARFVEDMPAPPMGVMETPRYVEHTLQLERGETLLLYTDGLVEKPIEVLDDRARAAARGGVRDGRDDRRRGALRARPRPSSAGDARSATTSR